MIRGFVVVASVVSLAFAAWKLSSGWVGVGQPASSRRAKPAASATSADARQRELLKEDLGKPADAVLAARFAAINAAHFSNSLSSIPVVWEPRLAEVGTLAGHDFTLLGVFGQSGDRSIILLHPSLKSDTTALDRALCHEMVHAYLFSVGDASTDHGEAFKSVLRRLSKEGAFISIEATPEERAELREWIDKESARMETERQELDRLAPEIENERLALQQAVEALNARVSSANAAGRGWPAQDEVAAINARRDAYNGRAAVLNRRGVEFRIAQDEYNRQVARFNLMASYPDGMDEGLPTRKRG
jgi:hypothetical protein